MQPCIIVLGDLFLHILGIYTGSIYHDSTLRKRGFPGEGTKGTSVVVTKTHEGLCTRKGHPLYERAILVIRNPYDSMIAEFNRKVAGHRGLRSQKYFGSPGP